MNNTILPLEYYTNLKLKGKFNHYLKKAEKIGFNSTEYNTYLHKACHIIKTNLFTKNIKNNTLFLHSSIDLNDFVNNLGNSDKINEIYIELDCGRINEKGLVYNYEYLFPNLENGILENKLIFLIFDIDGYSIIETEEKKNSYTVHSTCLLFIKQKNIYQCYYFNSHGKDIRNYTEHEQILSNKRKKKYIFDESIEIILIKSIINNLNNYCNLKKNIKFSNSSKYIYYGANLQSGDNKGICFIFPVILWYNIGLYYYNNRIIYTDSENIVIKSGEELLKENKFGLFIEYIFIDFSKNYKNMICQQIIKNTNRISNIHNLSNLIENDKHFIKNLVKSCTNFLFQKEIKKKIMYL